jgi:hypothetical protein
MGVETRVVCCPFCRREPFFDAHFFATETRQRYEQTVEDDWRNPFIVPNSVKDIGKIKCTKFKIIVGRRNRAGIEEGVWVNYFRPLRRNDGRVFSGLQFLREDCGTT